jgi:hypothetical protein
MVKQSNILVVVVNVVVVNVVFVNVVVVVHLHSDPDREYKSSVSI